MLLNPQVDHYVARLGEGEFLVADEKAAFLQALDRHRAGCGAAPSDALAAMLDEVGAGDWLTVCAERSLAGTVNVLWPEGATASCQSLTIGTRVQCRGAARFADEAAAQAGEKALRANAVASGSPLEVSRDGALVRVRRTLTEDEFRHHMPRGVWSHILDGREK